MKRQLGDGAAAAPSKQARTAASPSDDSWAACAAWVSANGGSVGGVAVGTDAAGLRGLQAVVELEPERTLLRVPRRCVLTADRAAQSPRLVHIAPHLTEGQLRHSRSDVLLALFLLLDREDPASFFAPYHATLPACEPQSVAALPVHWPAPSLQLLAGCSRFGTEIQRQRDDLTHDHAAIVRAWKRCAGAGLGPTPPSLAGVEWGLGMVASRAFELQWRGDAGADAPLERGVDTMVPLFDLGNHKRPRDVSYETRSQDGEALEVKTLRAFGEGEAVFMTYGAQPNTKLLQDYGFTTLPNIEPDGSSNDLLVLELPTDGDASGRTELKLRMARDTSYTYFEFLKAIDAMDRGDTSGAEEQSAVEVAAGAEEAAAGGAGAAGFADFEAAMAAMEGDDDDAADEELYGAAEGALGEGGEYDDDEDGEDEEAEEGGGERRERRQRTHAALEKLVAELKAVMAGYAVQLTCVSIRAFPLRCRARSRLRVCVAVRRWGFSRRSGRAARTTNGAARQQPWLWWSRPRWRSSRRQPRRLATCSALRSPRPPPELCSWSWTLAAARPRRRGKAQPTVWC